MDLACRGVALASPLKNMANNHRATCKVCGGHKSEVGEISWEGYCIQHGVEARDRANDELHFHHGPTFEKWRRAMAACVGGVLIEDAEGS